jgi:ABC-type uncharacterized transport system permease subunit
VITLSLIVMTVLSLAACVVAFRRLRHPGENRVASPIQQGLVSLIGAGAAALFVYRWLAVHNRWQPLTAHLDGLLLLAVLFAAMAIFIQSRPRLLGLSAFALPLLTLVLAWSICASAWTYRPFDLESAAVWKAVHLAGVYLGTLCAGVAAIAGGMFLYVRSFLKRKVDLSGLGRLASLETLEGVIIKSATLGFALLTLGLVSGLVILSSEPAVLGDGWWYSAKIVTAAAAWLVYAVVMNVRYATSFRGARAAWLSIAGLVLLLVTYGIVTALPSAAEAHMGLSSADEGPAMRMPAGGE